MAKDFKRYESVTAKRIELKSLNPEYENRAFALNAIVFVHRMICASQ